jgi:hypothetical protein
LGYASAVGLILLIGGCLWIRGDEDECAAGSGAFAETAFAQCVPSETAGAKTPDTDAPSTDDTTSATGTTIDFQGGAAGSHNTPDGQPAAPPAAADLAPGQQLFQGSSGDQVGFIAQDGASRFLSLERPGVVVGNVGITSQAMTWPTTGTVIEFGVRTSASSNDGRYGFNLFLNGTKYTSGCALEVGQTSCLFEIRGDLVSGDSVVIIIGEQGHLEETGDFTLDWWFIFEPAA